MASELTAQYQSGLTLYATIANAAGLYWTGSTFEAYNSAHLASYAVALAEQGPSILTPGLYVGDLPAGIVVAAEYTCRYYAQAASTPATTDQLVGLQTIQWTSVQASAAAGTLNPSMRAGYLSAADAIVLAGQMIGAEETAFLAATSSPQQASLSRGADEIDRGMRYQGRKYSPGQLREFPRIAYESSTSASWVGGYPSNVGGLLGYGESILDFDWLARAVVIPQNVRMANIIQAGSIILATREDRLNAIHDGLKGAGTGSLREEYDAMAPGVRTRLCSRAYDLLKHYLLTSGRID